MKTNFKGFAAGLIVGVVGITTVFAAGGIKSAEFNTNKVVFNGKELNLSSQAMISVVKEGESNPSNYMPVRAVLEQMGYRVDWNADTNSVVVTNEDIILSDGTNISKIAGDNGIDLNKGLDNKYFESDKTWREVLKEDGFDIEQLKKDGTLTKLKDNLEIVKALNLSDEVAAILLIDDYNTYVTDGDSLFGEVWEAIFED